MKQRNSFFKFGLTMFLLGSLMSSSVAVFGQKKSGKTRPQISADGKIGAQAMRQIEALNAEKDARTPAQQKIDSQLIYAAKMNRGEPIAEGVDKLEVSVKVDAKGFTLVDIDAQVGGELLGKIKQLGGQVVSSFKEYNAVRALLPLDSLEELAASDDVRFIRPADEPQLENPALPAAGADKPTGKPTVINPIQTGGRSSSSARPSNFGERAALVRAQLAKEMPKAVIGKLFKGDTPPPIFDIGAATSQGDGSHRAAEARAMFGVNGAGIKVGVLSDSYNATGGAAADVTSGDLPGVNNPNHYFTPVTVLQDAGGADEGRAMLQIIHDLAPGAQLFYATAVGGPTNFANNIRALRQAGCDIIIDDVSYPTFEQPFQDGIIALAVNDVTIGPGALAGASYFSSAGNAGNVDDNTAGVWEGDFNDSGSTGGITGVSGGTFHDFDPTPATVAIQNPVSRTSSSNTTASLFWSDPFGGSTNDYDLYLIENNGTAVVAASTTVQNGTQNPVENVSVPASSATAPAGRRIAIFKKTAAAIRALHINLNRNQFKPVTNAQIPAFVTPGQTRGHSAAAAAFSTAAAPATGTTFTSATVSETFTSDGPRRVFLNPDGTPITAGCVLFTCNGGVVRQKPDITAADGVSTTLPASSGLNPFFGTSAAAPHAGAIAALIKSANRSAITAAQIRSTLISSAIDIEAAGTDRDTGVGIVMAYQSLALIGATPQAFVNIDSLFTTIALNGSDGDNFLEPGENGIINLQVTNTGGGTATGTTATLTTTTPGVTITRGTATFPTLAPNQTASNSAPFTFSIDPNAPCGLKINFTVTVNYGGGNTTPQTTNFVVQTGQPSTVFQTTSYTGPPVAIPDADAAQNPGTVNIPFVVSGVSGNIANLKFRFDGTACNTTIGSTTVGLDHTFVGDLVIQLISPAGTTIALASNAGGAGKNFCQTVFDDAATASIQTAPATQAPFTGTFKPAQPLSTFTGENPNGTWTLRVTDTGNLDTGSVRAFSLLAAPFACGLSPTAGTVDVSGRVTAKNNRGVARARVSLSDGSGAIRTATTNQTGYYRFTDVAVGESYVFQAKSKGYKFAPQAVNITEETQDLNFTALY